MVLSSHSNHKGRFMKIYKPEIKHTKDYDSFQHFESNRPVNKKHLQSLIQDPTFPAKFSTCPIVVDANLYIIDGQHRFFAAKKLGIPVFYIIDPTATENDINIRNTQTRRWSRTHYIHFYVDKNPSYRLIKELMEEHHVHANFVLAVIRGVLPESTSGLLKYQLRKGEINCIEKENEIREVLRTAVPAIKLAKESKGDNARYLMMDSYATAFAKIYMESPEDYQKILNKIAVCSILFVHTTNPHEAIRCLKAVARWKVRITETVEDDTKAKPKAKLKGKAKQPALFV